MKVLLYIVWHVVNRIGIFRNAYPTAMFNWGQCSARATTCDVRDT